MLKISPVLLLVLSIFCSCSVSKQPYSPNKKYSKTVLQQDYTLLRNIFETKHPSLYWYTSKDSMDMYFAKFYNAIEDSMTEAQFGWKIIAPLTDKIHCGHTSFGMSKAYNKWVEHKLLPTLPLFMKVWGDTMVITGNLNRRDSILTRGTVIKSINGLNTEQLTGIMFNYMTEDGNANNVNYIRLSSNFPYYHRNILGLSRVYTVNYLDSNNNEQTIKVPLFDPPKDTSKRSRIAQLMPPMPRKDRKENGLRNIRSLAIDTANNTALITLNTFSTGKLRKFFRQTFRYIKKTGITNTILDIRSNGGGKINLSTLLTKYVTRQPFKVADSSFAVTKSLRPYSKYIKGKFLNNLGLFFLTKKRKDGMYHFGMWEKKLYHPKTKNHYDGDLYVLINGQTFSASALFCNAIKGQPGIKIVGEEAGGGWYGNNGIMIPDITLPNTHLRVRLPLFRLVQYHHVAKDGHGVMPDIYVGTSYDALIKGYDKKMQVVMDMIKKKRELGTGN